MKILLIIQLLFILYYSYVIYIFYKLNENSCECEKLEKFKQTYTFKLIFALAFGFLFYNINVFMKHLKGQLGGAQDMYLFVLILISLGYGASFVFDVILLQFFNMMKENKCPCQKKHRERLTNITYGKFTLNMFLYLKTLQNMDSKKFKAQLKKLTVKMKKDRKANNQPVILK